MSNFKATNNLLCVQNLSDLTGMEANSTQDEWLIASRLRMATRITLDQEASSAWRDRRLIRARMEYYTSNH
jgi:hypothetical protein